MATEDEFGWVSFEGSSSATKVRMADLKFAAEETREPLIGNEPEWCERLFLQHELWEEEASVLALLDTLAICDEEQIVLPTWAKEALQDTLIKRALGERQEAVRTGRASTTSREHRNGMLQRVRKDTVTRIRYYQALEPCLFSFSLLPVGLKRIHAGKPYPDLGSTLEEALHHAHAALAGTIAQAAEETLRKAYFQRDEDAASPWELASLAALEAVGFEVERGQYLPEGYEHAALPSEIAAKLPSQLVEGEITPMPDEVSQRYIEQASRFDDFADFIAAVRRKDYVP